MEDSGPVDHEFPPSISTHGQDLAFKQTKYIDLINDNGTNETDSLLKSYQEADILTRLNLHTT